MYQKQFSLGCSSVVEQTALNRPTGVQFPPPLPYGSRLKERRWTLNPPIGVRVPAPVPMPRESADVDACLSSKVERSLILLRGANVPIVYMARTPDSQFGKQGSTPCRDATEGEVAAVPHRLRNPAVRKHRGSTPPPSSKWKVKQLGAVRGC